MFNISFANDYLWMPNYGVVSDCFVSWATSTAQTYLKAYFKLLVWSIGNDAFIYVTFTLKKIKLCWFEHGAL